MLRKHARNFLQKRKRNWECAVSAPVTCLGATLDCTRDSRSSDESESVFWIGLLAMGSGGCPSVATTCGACPWFQLGRAACHTLAGSPSL